MLYRLLSLLSFATHAGRRGRTAVRAPEHESQCFTPSYPVLGVAHPAPVSARAGEGDGSCSCCRLLRGSARRSIDGGVRIAGGPPGSAEEDGDRFVEIWNLVFMQYEEGPPGVRAPLPRPSIDTGMGLERFAAILQGKHDNYDTDTFRALILASAEASTTRAGSEA